MLSVVILFELYESVGWSRSRRLDEEVISIVWSAEKESTNSLETGDFEDKFCNSHLVMIQTLR